MKRKARKQHKPGDLARLIALYRWEWNSLNQYPTPDDKSQAKFDVLVKKTYSRITKMLIGVPALCYEDALIAIDLLAWVAAAGRQSRPRFRLKRHPRLSR